jgi:hypothetical protein
MKLIKNSLYEMSTVGRSYNDNFYVGVYPDFGRNNTYFKVYNHINFEVADKVIRLDFRQPVFYDHKSDGKKLWKLNNKTIKKIMDFMISEPTKSIGRLKLYSKVKNSIVKFETESNWQYAIFLWNDECGFLNHEDLDIGYSEGCNSDSELFKDPQFVPFNTLMPNYLELQF